MRSNVRHLLPGCLPSGSPAPQELPAHPGLLAFSLLPPHLAAVIIRNCNIGRNPLACRLDSILHILYGAAFILGIVLLAVIWGAVRLYRRHRSRRTVVGEDE